MSKNIYPVFDKFSNRASKETILGQKGLCYWLYGQSGSGKTTIAIELEKKLTEEGKFVIVLDGDNLRTGLNSDIGFTTEDRMENIRRAAEVAKILVENGVIVIACFICPLISMRSKAKEIIGANFIDIYIKASIETLIQRDTKGFYKKAIDGKMDHLTGINSKFEDPINTEKIVNTDTTSVEKGIAIILKSA